MKKLLASISTLCVLVSLLSGLRVFVRAEEPSSPVMLQAFDGGVAGSPYTFVYGDTSAITALTYTDTNTVSGTALQATLKEGSAASNEAQGIQLRISDHAAVKTAAASKKYLMWHVRVPDMPEGSRRADFKDANGNPCFGVSPYLVTGAYYKIQGSISDRVTLFPDSGGWIRGETNDKWVCLPYGYSGWVRLSLDSFKGFYDSDPAMNLANISDFFFLVFSQMNSDTVVNVDSILLANEGDAITGFTVPSQAVEIQDFGKAPLLNSSIWNVESAPAVEAVESVSGAVSGPYGCEIRVKADSQDGFYNPNVVGATKNVSLVQNKHYVALHVTVPNTPEAARDSNVLNNKKEPCFRLALAFRSSDGAVWSYVNKGGSRFGDRAEVLNDGETSWKRGLTKDAYVYLPYGFSGWVRLELDNFVGALGGGAPIDRTKMIDTWDLTMSSISKATAVTVDAFYAADATDLLPGSAQPMGQPVSSEPAFANQAAMLQSFNQPGEGGDLINHGIWAYDPTDKVDVKAVKGIDVDGDDYGCTVSIKDTAGDSLSTYMVLEAKELNDAKGKRYWLFHITVPNVPAEKQNDAFIAPNGTRYFGVRIGPRTIVENKGWTFGNNGGYFRDRIEILANGETAWKRGVSKNDYACLPYGFSGWVKLDLNNFLFIADKSTPLDTAELADSFEVQMSQIVGADPVKLDAFYAANKSDYVPGIDAAIEDMVPSTAGETKEAAVLQDFEEAGKAGDNVAESGLAFWRSEITEKGAIVAELNADTAANGKLGSKIYSGNGKTLESPVLVGQMVDLDGVKSKRYVAFHITVPKNPGEKLDNCYDVDNNLYFGVSLGFRTKEETGNRWWILNGDFFKDKVELFVDGGSKWIKGLTKDANIFLPFGYSGWVRVDLQDYCMADTISDAKLDATKLYDIFDLSFSQLNGEKDAVYVDSFFAMNADDNLPGLVVTENGSNDAGYPQKEDPGKEEPTDPTQPTTPADPGTEESENVNTPVTGESTQKQIVLFLLIAGALLAGSWAVRCARVRGEKKHEK